MMLVRDIEKAIAASEQIGPGYGSMSLSKSALVHLMRRLNASEQGERVRILELGGGQSSIFWSAVSRLGLLPLQVTSLEHHPDWVNQLRAQVDGDVVYVSPQTLKQISDADWERMFNFPEEAAVIWEENGDSLHESQYNNYTIHNAFYGEAHQLYLESESVHVMILDGPHGNGRSLAFPLFAQALHPEALLLIDDFDHYPFLNDLGRLFNYNELYREIAGDKRWVLVQIQGKKYG